MTKQERERVRRAAAVIAVAVRCQEDDDPDRWDALRRWREGEALTEEAGPTEARS